MERAEILHFECYSGIAGDMFLGACLDLGMPLAVIEEAVAAVALPGVTVEAERALRGGVSGYRFRVLENGRPADGGAAVAGHGGGHDHGHHQVHDHGHHHHDGVHVHGHDHAADHSGGPHHDSGHHHHGHSHHHEGRRDLAAILDLLAESRLAPEVRQLAERLFLRLGAAEAKVHGVALERVHFHEVGAVDSIVDLVGAAAAWSYLAPRRVTCGPVHVGSGQVQTAHGLLPVPAPATAELLVGIPIVGEGGGELVTPTGAVLLAELVDEYVAGAPAMHFAAGGYGLGERDPVGRPNAFRLLAGRPLGGSEAPRVAVIEAQVDDLSGEGLGFVAERLLARGALDVTLTPTQMKKGRPGTLITVLARPAERQALAELLLQESGSLGCRWHEAERLEVERTQHTVETEYGEIRVKVGRLPGRFPVAAPEYEDCRRRAQAEKVPWRVVWQAALVAADELLQRVAEEGSLAER